MRLSNDGRVCAAAALSVLLHSPEIWPLTAENVQGRRLYKTERIWWRKFISNFMDGSRVLGWTGPEVNRLRWLRPVSHMSVDRLPRYILFSEVGNCLKVGQCDQPIVWMKGMKTVTSELSPLVQARILCWNVCDLRILFPFNSGTAL